MTSNEATPPRELAFVRRRSLFTLLLCLVMSGFTAEAQRNYLSVGLNIGTKGMVGLDLSKEISPRVNLRFGLNYMNFSIRDFETNLNRFEHYASVDADVRHSGIELLAEYRLIKSWLRIAGGAAIYWNDNFSGKVGLAGNYPLNDLELTAEEIGYMTGTLSFRSPVSPYLGIALGNPFPAHRISLSLDLGVYYKGRPTLDLNGTNLVRNNYLNAEILERNIDPYRWWPVVNLRLGYGLFHPESIKSK